MLSLEDRAGQAEAGGGMVRLDPWEKGVTGNQSKGVNHEVSKVRGDQMGVSIYQLCPSGRPPSRHTQRRREPVPHLVFRVHSSCKYSTLHLGYAGHGAGHNGPKV